VPRAVTPGALPVAEARALARRIALAMSRARTPESAEVAAASGAWRSIPWRGGPGEIDVEATIEARLARPPGSQPELFVRERRARRRAIIVLADISGSSRGPRFLHTAAMIGAVAGALPHDDICIMAFWSDAVTLMGFGEPATTDAIIDRLAQLRARGLTNVAFPLELAAQRLSDHGHVADRRVILLSDCVHNAGPDPRHVAARLPRLDVLVDVTDECDRELAADLATAGGGRSLPIRRPADIGAALGACLRS